MENEINKIKKLYLSKEAPTSLGNDGLLDLWKRVDRLQAPHRFYFSRMAITAVIVLIVFTGFIGIAQAAKPGTTFYPVKIATQKVIANITRQTPQQVENEIEKLIPASNTNAAPTATPSPVIHKNAEEKTRKNSNEELQKVENDKNFESDRVNNRINQRSQNLNNDQYQEDVKGISTEIKKIEPTQKVDPTKTEIQTLEQKPED